MTTDPHPWAQTLAGLHAQAWRCLQRAVHDRHAAARHPTLATVCPQGWPQARTIVLRAADPAGAVVQVHTDIHSAKVTELRALPRASLHVWDKSAHLQVRMQAEVEFASGAQVEALWAQMPEQARLSYGSAPPTGTPLDAALAYARKPDPAAFVVLNLRLQQMELLHLGRAHHRRARFSRAEGWAGQWLVP